MTNLKNEVKEHLQKKLVPFWASLRDDEFGGYYSLLDYDLKLHKKAVKGCILNSRILWFFSNAYMTLGDKAILDEAKHAYEFLRDYCLDKEYGGVLWSVKYNGEIDEDIKHTYNQAFAIYALSSYYDASGDKEALGIAYSLFDIIESKCCDGIGYLESFERNFTVSEDNEKLSENGVNAEKTMNTLLHVFEAYTELLRVTGDERVRERLIWILHVFKDKVYNPTLKRQEVFFDKNWNSIIDLHSYGHDIETAWLLDRGCDLIGDKALTTEIHAITNTLAEEIYNRAYVDRSLLCECEKGVDDTDRIWWIQAETIVGFTNAYEKTGDEKFKKAALDVWEYIKEYIIDKREGSEWYWRVDENGEPIVADVDKDIVEPWKCPYHNGRMCMELIKRKG